MSVPQEAYYAPPVLTAEEQALPLARFFERFPMPRPDPVHQQLLDAGPMDPADAIPAPRWLDALAPHGYRRVEYGWCILPDGSGYCAEYYTSPPVIRRGMRPWYMQWMNHPSRSMVPGQGNLRYKLWMHLDHWDHRYVNGVDGADGVWAMGSLDMGRSRRFTEEVAHDLDLRAYGLTPACEAALRAARCEARACCEEVEGGHHLVLRLNRPCPFGGTETLAHEWIGWRAENGKIVRDAGTPCSAELLKNILTHNTVEHAYTQLFLPALWEAYHALPADAD